MGEIVRIGKVDAVEVQRGREARKIGEGGGCCLIFFWFWR